MKSDPIRLLDDAGTTSAIRTVLEAGRQTHPVAYDGEAAAARFRALLAGGAVTGAVAVGVAESISGAQGLRGLLGKTAVKVGLAVVIPAAGVYAVATSVPGEAPVASSAGTGGFRGSSVAEQPAAAPPAAPTVAQEKLGSSVLAFESLPLGETPSGEVPLHVKPRASSPLPPSSSMPGERSVGSHSEPSPARAGTAEPGREKAADTPAAEKAADTSAPRKEEPPSGERAREEAVQAPVADGRSAAAEEMRGVMEARALQRTNPGQALEILARLQQKYPRGYFLEERRAISVMALFRSGNAAQGRKQGAAFLQAYPNGTFTDEIRRLMDR